MLRQMRRWAIEQSPQGPVYLGYRLGHIKAEGRVFRALVYNKGAMVLHMLRRLIGDEKFFAGLRRVLRDVEVPQGRHRRFPHGDGEGRRDGSDGVLRRLDLRLRVPVLGFTSPLTAAEARVRFEHRGG